MSDFVNNISDNKIVIYAILLFILLWASTLFVPLLLPDAEYQVDKDDYVDLELLGMTDPLNQMFSENSFYSLYLSLGEYKLIFVDLDSLNYQVVDLIYSRLLPENFVNLLYADDEQVFLVNGSGYQNYGFSMSDLSIQTISIDDLTIDEMPTDYPSYVYLNLFESNGDLLLFTINQEIITSLPTDQTICELATFEFEVGSGFTMLDNRQLILSMLDQTGCKDYIKAISNRGDQLDIVFKEEEVYAYSVSHRGIFEAPVLEKLMNKAYDQLSSFSYAYKYSNLFLIPYDDFYHVFVMIEPMTYTDEADWAAKSVIKFIDLNGEVTSMSLSQLTTPFQSLPYPVQNRFGLFYNRIVTGQLNNALTNLFLRDSNNDYKLLNYIPDNRNTKFRLQSMNDLYGAEFIIYNFNQRGDSLYFYFKYLDTYYIDHFDHSPTNLKSQIQNFSSWVYNWLFPGLITIVVISVYLLIRYKTQKSHSTELYPKSND